MGLDIYLYQYKNYADTIEREEKAQEHSAKLWESLGEYKESTQEQKDEIRAKEKEFYGSLGLDEWGSDITNKISQETDHPDYPEHLFKIGYFRSSYNDGGIERILKNYGLPTLCDVFGKDTDDYHFQPNWEESLTRINSLIEDFEKVGEYRVKPIYAHSLSHKFPTTPEDALKLYLQEKEKSSPDYNYSNALGEFNFSEPEEILAYIPGKCRYIFNDRECVYAIVKSDNKWYKEALIIVRDTIKFVLSQENKEQYYLHWSG